jgi:hypothetical protein
VEYKNLQAQSVEDLLNQVQGLAAVASEPQVRSVAALAARCTIELAAGMGQLSAGLFDAKRLLADRLTELSTELRAFKTEVANASTQATAQTQALVLWTRVLVGVTALYTLLTGGLLLVALKKLGG